MGRKTDKRLMVMMFLQYAVWGAWVPIAARYMSGHLGFTDGEIGWILGLAASAGAITAPFIAGQLADRYFPAQRFLALLLAVGGVIQIFVATQTSFVAWLVLAICYSIVYMPTLALSNSIAFAHMDDQEKQFPLVRVWGTIGWIAASWAFPMIWLLQNHFIPPVLAGAFGVKEVANSTAEMRHALTFSGIISLAYAVFGMMLPNTPPKRDGVEKLAFAKAFRLLKNPSFAVLFFIALPIATIHQIYFIQTAPFFSAIGLQDSVIGPAMTLGQIAEIVVMACLGLLLTRLGFRSVIFCGTMAYVVRYLIFGSVWLPVPIIVASQFLHGFCYACFFAASFIYVDRISPPDIRHSAQTMYGIFILGAGPVLGGYLSGKLAEAFSPAGVLAKNMTPAQLLEKFQGIWYTVAGIALVTGLIFLLLFRSQVGAKEAVRTNGKPQAEGAPSPVAEK